MSDTTSEAHNKLVRDLGVSEDIIDALNGLGAYLFSVVLFLQTQKPLTRDVMEETLSYLQTRHPLLRSTIRTHHGRRRFEPMARQALDFEMVDDVTDWEDVYERMLTELFDTESGPLWRVKAVLCPCRPGSASSDGKQRYAVIFTLHHAMSDGIGTASLMSEFAQVLDENMDKDASSPKTVCQPLPLMPTMEELMSEDDVSFGCMDIPSVIGLAADMMFPAKNPYLKKYPAEVTLDPCVNVGTKVLRFSLSKSETDCLLKACKGKKVSVHGALTSAASMAAALNLNNKKSFKVRSRHTVDLRKFLQPAIAPEHMAYLVSTMDACLSVKTNSTTSFWNYAKKANKQIQRGIYFKDYTKPIRIAQKLYQREAFMKKMEQLSRTNGGRDEKHFTLTNLGSFDRMFGDVSTKHFDVVDLLVGTGVQKLGPIFMHNVTTFRGQLHWNLSYATNVTTTQNAVKYLHAIHISLLQALKEIAVSS